MATATKTVETKYPELTDQNLTAIEVISRELKNRKKAEDWKQPAGLVDFTVHIYGSLVQGKDSTFPRKSTDYASLIRALLAEMDNSQKKAALARLQDGSAKKLKSDVKRYVDAATEEKQIHRSGSIHGTLEVQMVDNKAETIEKMRFPEETIADLAKEIER